MTLPTNNPRASQPAPSARRLLIDMALARVQPGAGSGADFMRRRTAMQEFPNLSGILEGVDWVVVGAVAARAYMPERATQDLDILIRATDAETVAARLAAAGFLPVADLGIPGAAFAAADAPEIDVLYGDQPWLDEALAQPQRDPAGLPVLALPYLVLMKMAAGRVRDVGDVATMLGWADEVVLDAVREAVAHYAPADRVDLESLIYLGRRERGLPE
jgi:hypothetical protein